MVVVVAVVLGFFHLGGGFRGGRVFIHSVVCLCYTPEYIVLVVV